MRCEVCREFVDLEGAKFCPGCGAIIPEPPPDPLIGEIVGGRYRVVSLVAEGGMGRVYAGEQRMGAATRKVAIKVLLAEYAASQVDMERFARECGTVAELDHPNTIKFYDYGTTSSGEPYIAMEFLAGQSLSQILKKGPISPDRMDLIVGQICGSLQEAHDRGIIHRDLKPDNIVITSPGGAPDFVKVLDFGIAKRLDRKDIRLTPLGVVLGSPPYMSPEQFTLHEIDARSDVYSLGVMAFQALTGKLPFEADGPMQWAHLHINTAPLPFEATPDGRFVPDSMKSAVMRALSKHPMDRHASMREFFSEFSIGSGSLPGGRLPSLVPSGPDLVAMARPSDRPPAISRPPSAPHVPSSGKAAAQPVAPQPFMPAQSFVAGQGFQAAHQAALATNVSPQQARRSPALDATSEDLSVPSFSPSTKFKASAPTASAEFMNAKDYGVAPPPPSPPAPNLGAMFTRETDRRSELRGDSESAPNITYGETRSSSLSLPNDELGPPTEEQRLFGKAGTMVMNHAALPAPVRAAISAYGTSSASASVADATAEEIAAPGRITLNDAMPATIRDADALAQYQKPRGRGKLILAIAALLVVGGGVAFAIWWFALRAEAPRPKGKPRPAETSVVN
ncbi:MAG: protein kinase [Polyangiaceae bacterium]